MCGSVWYTVTILTEGGMLIITDNTTMTNYNVTGLNDNTVYHVSVTASNNAGSSNSSANVSNMTNSNGKLYVCIYKYQIGHFPTKIDICLNIFGFGQTKCPSRNFVLEVTHP